MVKIDKLFIALLIMFWSSPAFAATIAVTTADGNNGNDLVEGAACGDTVTIAPGTYSWRVNLTKTCTEGNALTVQALDPNDRPLFDYSACECGSNGWGEGYCHGTYSASDADKGGCWRLEDGSAYITIDGIMIKGCHNTNTENGHGIRNQKGKNITVKNTKVFNCNVGIGGGGSSYPATDHFIIEYCELDNNSYLTDGQRHNIYILWGNNFTIRYSYIHDPTSGQNLHSRAWHNYIYYNWFEHGATYEADIQSVTDTDPGDHIQHLWVVGNVFIPKTDTYKVISAFNNSGTSGLIADVKVNWNTFYPPVSYPTILQFRDYTSPTLDFNNNIVGENCTDLLDETYQTPTITGTKNWFKTGSSINTLSNTVFGSTPGFTNAPTDFTLASGSTAKGIADITVTPYPSYSYAATCSYTARSALTDAGAYQTSSPQGCTISGANASGATIK